MGKKRSLPHHNGPDVVDMDLIASMSDDELLNRFQRLDSERETMRENRVPTRDWEVEIAYVRREQQLRRQRREAHDSYLSSNRAANGEVDVLSDEYDAQEDAAAQA